MVLLLGYIPSGDQRVEWFSKIAHALKQYDFIHSQADTTLFTLKTNHSFLVVLAYVDDIVIAGNDSFQCQKFKQFLHGQFHLKDLWYSQAFSWP